MTKITNLGRNEHRIVSQRVLDALKTLEAELGVKFAPNGGTYGAAGTGTISLRVEVLNTAAGISAHENLFKTMASTYGLKPEWFGQTFIDRGTAYKITGMNTGAPKYPVMVERVHDKKSFKFTAIGVREGMNRVEAVAAFNKPRDSVTLAA